MVKEKVSFVGLVERFDESLVMFRAWAGMPTLDLRYRSLNVSATRSVRDHFLVRELLDSDADLAAAIEEANREDLKLYRWVVDEVYPCQQEQYESELLQELRPFREANACANIRWSDSIAAKAYRNAVFKPLRRIVLPQRSARTS